MFELLKSRQWSFVSVGPKCREPWTLDRGWHRSEAGRHLKAHNYVEAARYLALAVEEADRRRGPARQRVRLRLELADAQRQTAGQGSVMHSSEELLDRAEATARAAIAIAAETSDQEQYLNCLDALADVFLDKKDFLSLETVEQEAIRLGSTVDRPDTLRMAKRVHRLGLARHKNGERAQALPALERSLRLHEECLGSDSAGMGAILHETGCIYRAQGEFARAQECLHRALRIHENRLGPESAEATADLQQLAGAYEDAGDLDKAAEQYERCLMLKLRKIGVKHIEEVAMMQYSLANLHAGWGNLARARELLTDSIGAFRRDGGPRLAVAHEMLAQIEERGGRFHEAIKALEHAGKVWEKCGRTSELIRNLTYRADLLDQLRKHREAAWLRERATALELELPAQAQGA